MLNKDKEPVSDYRDDTTAEVPRYRGRIKWFNFKKGFGFIVPEGLPLEGEDRSKNIFFHITEFKSNVSLETGQVVEYAIAEAPEKGLDAKKAVDLVLIRFED